ncbi:unnamed protein product, partial [Polarella glacialis]
AFTAADADSWLLSVDASQLEPGRHYHLCVDLDGSNLGALDVGDSGGPLIYISPAEAGSVQTVMEALGQTFVVSCVTGAACATSTAWHLVAGECGQPGEMPAADASGFFLKDQAGWVLAVDGQLLKPGAHYHLCLDVDGPLAKEFQSGDSGLQVYVSGVLLRSPAEIFAASAEQLTLRCSLNGCPAGAMAWLAETCGSEMNVGQ